VVGQEPGIERRAMRRFPLQLPVSLQVSRETPVTVPGETRDISARGVLIFTDTEIGVGSRLDFDLILPWEVTLTTNLRVRCTGKVVRVQGSAALGKIGLGIAIDNYEFLSEGHS